MIYLLKRIVRSLCVPLQTAPNQVCNPLSESDFLSWEGQEEAMNEWEDLYGQDPWESYDSGPDDGSFYDLSGEDETSERPD